MKTRIYSPNVITLFIALSCILLTGPIPAKVEGGVPPPPVFNRGDANGDGRLDITDAIFILDFLFTSGDEITCLDAGNANGDINVDLSDAVYVLLYLFGGGNPPPAPFSSDFVCGSHPDPATSLGCAMYPASSCKDGVASQITSPAPGSTISTHDVTFSWNSGVGVTKYALGVGTTMEAISGGTGGDIFYGDLGQQTSVQVTNIPLDAYSSFGVIYVRLWSYINGKWQTVDYTYKLKGDSAEITSPVVTSAVGSSPVTFQWSRGNGVQAYALGVGTNLNSLKDDVTEGGDGTYGNITYRTFPATDSSVSVSGIPMDGKPFYARLWSQVNGQWYTRYYTFKARNNSAVITKPVLGSLISTTTTTDIEWSAGTGVSEYAIGFASSPQCLTGDILKCPTGDPYGDLGYKSTGLGRIASLSTAKLATLPTIYIRLWSKIDGIWITRYYSYQTQTQNNFPRITNPAPGSTLTTSSVTFQWSAPDPNVTGYELSVGTNLFAISEGAVGGDPATGGIFHQNVGKNLSVTVNDIPITGEPIYVRLWFNIGNNWSTLDYTFLTQAPGGGGGGGAQAAPAGVKKSVNTSNCIELYKRGLMNNVSSCPPTMNLHHPFIRGDANHDGKVDISDSIFINGYLGKTGPTPKCLDAADTNDNGKIDKADATYITNYLFLGGAKPKAPFPQAGIDLTNDTLTCGQ